MPIIVAAPIIDFQHRPHAGGARPSWRARRAVLALCAAAVALLPAAPAAVALAAVLAGSAVFPIEAAVVIQRSITHGRQRPCAGQREASPCQYSKDPRERKHPSVGAHEGRLSRVL